jgi:late competence protein required for DNA uptake (superfamily II DNA/RNA helicase)
MILTKTVKIKITHSNYTHFEDLDYEMYIGETIDVSVEHLQSGSGIKIKCKCDNCGVEKDVIFKNYLKYNVSWGTYYCRKCSDVKRKETMQKRWGVDSPIKHDVIKEQIKKTTQKLYGVDNAIKSPIIHNRRRKNKERKDGI